MIFLINTIIPVTLYSNMLTFGDSIKSFKLDGDLLKTMTKYDFNVGNSTPQNRIPFKSLEKRWNLTLGKKTQKWQRKLFL